MMCIDIFKTFLRIVLAAVTSLICFLVDIQRWIFDKEQWRMASSTLSNLFSTAELQMLKQK